MKLRYVLALVGAMGLISSAGMANAADISFQFDSTGLVANFTLDVVGGQAIGGTGTVTSPYWSGSDALTLVTLSTPDVHDLGGGGLSYRFGGGTDLIGDTTVPVDGNGLVFQIDTPSLPTLLAGLNIWSNGNGTYTAFLAGNAVTQGGPIVYQSFTGSLSAVPLPAALPMFGAAIAGLGALGLRRRAAKA